MAARLSPRAILFAVTIALALAAVSSRSRLAAQQPADIAPSALSQIAALLQEKDSRDRTHQKIESQLVYGLKMGRGEAIAAGVATIDARLQYEPDNRLVLDVSGDRGTGLAVQLVSAGVEVVHADPDYGTARVRARLDQVEAIAALPEVSFVQPKQEAVTSGDAGIGGFRPLAADARGLQPQQRARNRASLLASVRRALAYQDEVSSVGSKGSEGDVTHRAASARALFRVDGTGVKIGVLSDGVSHLATSQALGDLGQVTVLAGQAGVGDEGTAMLEIVHDLAPGAQLYFATAFTSITSFAQNIRDLRAAGCDIILDDVYYYVETPFQDGQAAPVIAARNGGVVIQAVKDVTAAGALYFSAAGNSGNKDDNTSGTWEGDFVDGGAAAPPIPTIGSVHRFGTQTYDALTQTNSALINLHWSDPLGGSTNDYDLFRLDNTGTTVLASSTNIQNGTQDPYEQISGGAAGNRIVIVKKTGAAGRFLHLDANRGSLSISTAGEIHGHAATTAANSFGVAATPAVGPYPSPFNAGNLVETFSSDGPRRIFFNGDGTPITPGNVSSTGGQVLSKPDVTAADGVSVTGVGNFPTPFFGTSAAAPHAGAIAALIKSANPTLTAAQVRNALVSTAIDIEAAGPDRDAGAGIIDALAAVQSIALAGNTPPSLSAIPAQTTTQGTPTPPIAFSVGDAETPAASLTVSAISSNLALVPAAGLVFGGGAANRTLTITPAAGQSYGTAVVQVSVSDGLLASSGSFVVTVVPSGQAAVYDATLQTPKCGAVGSSCQSGTLLVGNDTMIGGPEPHQPNTILGTCADGTKGSFHFDESVDAIKVSTVDGSAFAPGKMVTIATAVWVYAPSLDRLDLYYASDATNPNWTLIGTQTPSQAGAQTLSATYALPAGNLQAVRASFRGGGTATACTSGVAAGYDDHDDLVFSVSAGGGTTAPVIVTQPLSQTKAAGESAMLSVTATGSAPLSYQWFIGTSGTTSSTAIPGASSSSYTTPALTSTTSYWVRVTNISGIADSSTAVIMVGTPPTITTQPQSQSGGSGQTATLSVVATGPAPLSYQWYVGATGRDTDPIVGATASVYTTPALTRTTSYWVRVSNNAGAADSNTATVTVVSPPTAGATFVVNSTLDAVDVTPGNGVCATATGVCTLRAAIQEANAFTGIQAIVLPAGTYRLTIPGRGEYAAATGDLNLASGKSITISGAGAATTIIDANGIDRAFQSFGGSLTLNDLTVQNGSSINDLGGCIFVSGTELVLNRAVVTACNAGTSSGGGIVMFGDTFEPSTLTLTDTSITQNVSASLGGGLYLSNASATLNRSTISGNSAAYGGGIIVFGTVDEPSALTVVNSTISGNLATSWGGGVYFSSGGAGGMTLTNVTIASNTSNTPGGGAVAFVGAGQYPVKNSIIANSGGAGSNNCLVLGGGLITDLGNNLEFPGTACGFTLPDDRQADPLLNALADNGGPTPTHALSSGSAAIDAGDDATCTAAPVSGADQRGLVRVGVCDIGAYEFGAVATPPAITTQPASQTVAAGQSVSFTVTASGSPAPTYQWQLSSDGGASWLNLTDTATYVGSATATLRVTSATGTLNANQYRAVASNNVNPAATSNAVTLTVYGSPMPFPATLQFGATKSGPVLVAVTPAQAITVTFSGVSSGWTASADQPWLQLAGAAGSAAGHFTVSIINPNDVIGAATTLSATITVSATTAGVLPVTVPVTLRVEAPGVSTGPFGSFDTPASGTIVAGSIAVTGWALDDIGVDRVELWRDLMAGETTPPYPGAGPGHGKVFIGNAFFVGGARPDVEAAYPDNPLASQAGWGYLLLTQGLWNRGNGAVTMYAFAFDQDGHSSTLGSKTFTSDNANAVKPFGAIDTPGPGQTVTTSLWNYGWALTPNATPSCTIPPTGVQVAIDSGPLMSVNYGALRTDVADAFPDLTNANGAGGSYYLDTTTLTDGTHQIGWLVTDSCGRQDGIGSRFFTVLNGGTAVVGNQVRRTTTELTEVTERNSLSDSTTEGTEITERKSLPGSTTELTEVTERNSLSDSTTEGTEIAERKSLPSSTTELTGRNSLSGSTTEATEVTERNSVSGSATEATEVTGTGRQAAGSRLRDAAARSPKPDSWAPVEVRRGGELSLAYPNSSGDRVVSIGQSERVELHLPPLDRAMYLGYQMVNGARRMLPLGSSLDSALGIFYWQPAAGFLGNYDLRFAPVQEDGNQRQDRAGKNAEKTDANGVVSVRVVVGPSLRTAIDLPVATEAVSQPFWLAGWTLDLVAAEGSGIDTVHVWAYPSTGGAPIFLGVAAYGDARPDVAVTYGAQFERSSYSLAVDHLPPGTYNLVVYPHSAVSAEFRGAQVMTITIR